MTTTHCGFDFGTSNSTVGTTNKHGAPQLLALEDANPTIPSVLFFSFDENQVHYGRRAVSEYAGRAEGRLLRSLKSVLGSDLMAESTRIKQRRMSFSEILEIFIHELKLRGEAAAGKPFESAVVGRPVRFVDDNNAQDNQAQNQLEAAMRAAGFKHVEFQFEPIAAALDYEQQVGVEELALVVDIGGGTSDFTIIRLSPKRSENVDRSRDILATGGTHVGGTDFDQLLSFGEIMPLLGLGSQVKGSARAVPVGPYFDLACWHRINRLYAARPLADLRSTLREAAAPDLVRKMLAIVEGHYGHGLAGEVEAAKITLSAQSETELHFAFEETDVHTRLTHDAFETAIADIAARIPQTINRVLKNAGLKTAQIQTVLMTGGSTQLRLIRSGLDRQFPDAKFFQTDVFGSVGTGLALDAFRRFG